MNAEIIQHGNGDCSVKLLPTYENEKFILDVMAVIDTMKSHIAECVARNTQVNVEYGELCKSYDELKASVAAFETLKSDYAEISAEYQKEWDRRKQCDRINAELKSELENKKQNDTLPTELENPLDEFGNRNWEGEYYRLLDVYNKDIGTLQEEIKGLRKEVEGRKLEVSHWNGLAATEAKKAEGWRVKYLEYYDKCVEQTKETAELKRQLAAMTKTVFENANKQTQSSVYVDCPFHKTNCFKDACIVHGTCVAQDQNNLP